MRIPEGTEEIVAYANETAGDGHAHADRFDTRPRCELCDPACANAAVFTLVAVGGPAWILCPFHLGDKLRDELTAAQWTQFCEGAAWDAPQHLLTPLREALHNTDVALIAAVDERDAANATIAALKAQAHAQARVLGGLPPVTRIDVTPDMDAMQRIQDALQDKTDATGRIADALAGGEEGK